jgi:DNA-binding GntR family transcriptional regulator
MLDETLLSQEYGLSRTPLREVFQKLAGDGYLSQSENRGTKVSSMDLANMRNFFQSAPMIYAAVARLAAENATKKQIESLKHVQQLFRRAGEASEPQEMAMHNHRFHEIIGEMADNPYLSPSLSRLLIDHTRMSQMFYKPINSKERLLVWEACDQHDAMIEAIEQRDASSIVTLTIEHWELSRDRMEKFVMPDPLDMEIGLKQAGE